MWLAFAIQRRPEAISLRRIVTSANKAEVVPLIFFRYIGDVLEIVNVLEAHRDVGAFFGDER